MEGWSRDTLDFAFFTLAFQGTKKPLDIRYAKLVYLYIIS